jgi:hypothetical protein
VLADKSILESKDLLSDNQHSFWAKNCTKLIFFNGVKNLRHIAKKRGTVTCASQASANVLWPKGRGTHSLFIVAPLLYGACLAELGKSEEGGKFAYSSVESRPETNSLKRLETYLMYTMFPADRCTEYYTLHLRQLSLTKCNK